MRRSVRLISTSALIVVCLIGVTACGSTHAPSVASLTEASETLPSKPSSTLTAWLAAVGCARAHGMPGLPDPIIEASGRVKFPGYRQIPSPTPEVESSCAAQIRAVESIAPTRESAGDIAALLRVARCIRAHGYPDWPDANAQGEFHVRSSAAGTPAKLNAAVTSCKSLFPTGGWHLQVTPSGH